MRAENLSSPSLMPTVQSTVKTYREKKMNLLDWALKSSKAAIVKAIIDLDLSNQQEARTQTSTTVSHERRRIAVFGVFFIVFHLASAPF